jgi:hypothetical protein
VSAALWDGLGAAVLSSVVSTGLALYVLRRTIKDTRQLAEAQRRADAESMRRQELANQELARESARAEYGLARELASLEAARVCIGSLAALLATLQQVSTRLSGTDRADFRVVSSELARPAAQFFSVANAYAAAFTQASLIDVTADAMARIDAWCGEFVRRGEAYLTARPTPDSREAASLTERDRAWQEYVTLFHDVASYVEGVLRELRTYQAGNADLAARAEWLPQRPERGGAGSLGLAMLLAWSGRDVPVPPLA